MQCYFCDREVTAKELDKGVRYDCKICGRVSLTKEYEEDMKAMFSSQDKHKLRIYFRHLSSSDATHLHRLVDLLNVIKSTPDYPVLEKMSRFLIWLGEKTRYGGHILDFDYNTDFPIAYCEKSEECSFLVNTLAEFKYIEGPNELSRQAVKLLVGGFKRLEELQKIFNSRQCFVAMWFADEINGVYDKAIKIAVEETEYTPLPINKKQHNNDINDEIIAEIKRSKFMIADLTGYRGGVYWEAGFAKGLGKEVIFTCRKDWHEPKKEKEGNKIIQEGVHFDLNHRNIILWTDDKLDEFKKTLIQRIRATVD